MCIALFTLAYCSVATFFFFSSRDLELKELILYCCEAEANDTTWFWFIFFQSGAMARTQSAHLVAMLLQRDNIFNPFLVLLECVRPRKHKKNSKAVEKTCQCGAKQKRGSE
ncbi:hypothetical protein CLU79DRAFT_764584 [Phycomyces nitens]|nr:hypothetical protein CLU79DRAFT_764584 [Phycomyces nitens]